MLFNFPEEAGNYSLPLYQKNHTFVKLFHPPFVYELGENLQSSYSG